MNRWPPSATDEIKGKRKPIIKHPTCSRNWNGCYSCIAAQTRSEGWRQVLSPLPVSLVWVLILSSGTLDAVYSLGENKSIGATAQLLESLTFLPVRGCPLLPYAEPWIAYCSFLQNGCVVVQFLLKINMHLDSLSSKCHWVFPLSWNDKGWVWMKMEALTQ